MNDAPTPEIPQQPTTQPVAQTPKVTPQGSQTLSTWSLILGIIAIVLAIVFFISIPAAIIAIILGIIVLAKHRPGRGKALAGIITGGLTLLIAPFLIASAVVVYNGINERVKDVQQSSSTQSANNVDTQCFSYAIPSGYKYDTASVACTTAVNIPKGDGLTRITVKGNTGSIGSLQDVVASFNKTLQNGDASAKGVVDQEQLTSHGRTVYYVSYKDANGLLFGNYITPDSSASQTVGGKTITAYTVAGYVYNSSLKGLVRGVLDSLSIK